MNFSVKITIPSDTRYLSPLRQFVAAAAKVVGVKSFPKSAQKACTLALIEAVDNAIFHAHRRRKNRLIDVALKITDEAIITKIVDKGRGFNHLSIRNPDPMITHGRGLFLMKQLMGKVESKRLKDGHAVILTYNL